MSSSTITCISLGVSHSLLIIELAIIIVSLAVLYTHTYKANALKECLKFGTDIFFLPSLNPNSTIKTNSNLVRKLSAEVREDK